MVVISSPKVEPFIHLTQPAVLGEHVESLQATLQPSLPYSKRHERSSDKLMKFLLGELLSGF